MLSLLLFLGLVLVLVWRFRQPIHSLVDFFLAGKTLGVFPIAITFVASWFGAASTIGTVNAVHEHGLVGLWQIAVPSVCSCLVITFFLAKRVHAQQSLSQPQAVERYYGPVGRLLLSLIVLASTITFVSAQLVAGGMVCQAAFGLDNTTAPLILATGVVIYSVLGGFLAVVITDMVQFVGFTLAILLLLGWTCWAGPDHVQILSYDWQMRLTSHLNFLPTSWSGEQGWMQQLGLLFAFVPAWCIAPEMWQRMTAIPTARQAKLSAGLASSVLLLLFMLIACIGMLSTLWIFHPDDKTILIDMAQMLPFPILTSVVVLGVMSAITSTMDSSLNVGSLTVVHDLYHRWLRPYIRRDAENEAELLWISRLSILLMAVVAVIIALRHKDLIETLWLSADIYASAMFVPIIGLLYLKEPPRLAGILAMAFGLVGIVLGHGAHSGWLPFLTSLWPAWPFSTIVGIIMSTSGFGVGCLLKPNQNGDGIHIGT